MICYVIVSPQTKGMTLEQMDEILGGQLVPHAMQGSEGASAAVGKDEKMMEQLDGVWCASYPPYTDKHISCKAG